jgi:hypothetical protein
MTAAPGKATMHWIPAVSGLAPSPKTNAGMLLPGMVLSISQVLAQQPIHLGLEQAQQRLFPGARLSAYPMQLSEAQRERMRALSSVREPFRSERIWRSDAGDWFIVDEVLGKHEMVKYALAIQVDGRIKGLEIMDYVESYGYEVARAEWRAQFHGKGSDAALKLNHDIRNISGATLSCKHVTDGVKRLMVLYELVLKPLSVRAAQR